MKFGVKRRCVNTSCSPEKDPAGPFSLFQAILAGDFILSAASMALARIGNITVVKVLSQVIEDLVRGTVTTTVGGGGTGGACASSRLCCALRGVHAAGIQGERERAVQTLPGENLQEDGEPHRQQLQSSMYVPSPDIWTRWRRKARSRVCADPLPPSKVSILVNSDPEVHEIAFQYGKNVGIAFQVVLLSPLACAAGASVIQRSSSCSWWTTSWTSPQEPISWGSPRPPTSDWAWPPGRSSSPANR